MKKKQLVRYTREEIDRLPDNTDWKRLRAMKDADIDVSDIPPLSKDFFKKVEYFRGYTPRKAISLRLEDDLIKWFKEQGGAYQTHMAAVLKAYRETRTS